MIYLVHGEDTESSYKKLQEIIVVFPSYKKIFLDEKNTSEDFNLNLYTQDLFNEKKIIICTNFLSDKKILSKSKDLNLNLENDAVLVFWEKKQLTPQTLSKLPKGVVIENFKKKPEMFWFLDSLDSSTKNNLSSFKNLTDKDNMLWFITNRVLLLLLAKLNANKEDVIVISGKNLADWQWQKIVVQSQKFSQQTLVSMLNGLVKADYSIKSGKTSLDDNDLLPHILVKYLGL